MALFLGPVFYSTDLCLFFCLTFCHYGSVVWFRSGIVRLPVLLLLLRILAWPFSLVCLHVNFGIAFLILWRLLLECLLTICNKPVFTILILTLHERGGPFCLQVCSSVSFFSGLKKTIVFSYYLFSFSWPYHNISTHFPIRGYALCPCFPCYKHSHSCHI